MIGALAVQHSPEDYRAYVAISQFVDFDTSQDMFYDRALLRARAEGDHRALVVLQEIGPPPYKIHKKEQTFQTITRTLAAGKASHPLTPFQFAALTFISPYYSIKDIFHIIPGMKLSKRALDQEIHQSNLLKSVPQLNVPVYFFEGRYDTVLSPVLAEKYFERLRAPCGKHLVWFEHSDHSLHIEERVKYRAMLLEVARRTAE